MLHESVMGMVCSSQCRASAARKQLWVWVWRARKRACSHAHACGGGEHAAPCTPVHQAPQHALFGPPQTPKTWSSNPRLHQSGYVSLCECMCVPGIRSLEVCCHVMMNHELLSIGLQHTHAQKPQQKRVGHPSCMGHN
eukprot:1157952-Pelagomonas_calceolata.AAC.2